MPTNLHHSRANYPRMFWVRSENVAAQPYFVGLQFRRVSDIVGSKQCIRQVRVGLIWWHWGVTFIA